MDTIRALLKADAGKNGKTPEGMAAFVPFPTTAEGLTSLAGTAEEGFVLLMRWVVEVVTGALFFGEESEEVGCCEK